MICRACHSPKLSYHSPVRDSALENAYWYLCADCGCLTSALSYADVRHLYDAQYLSHLVDGKHYDSFESLEESFRCHVERLTSICPPPARVLDVGCLDGSFLAAAQKVGYESHGFDVTAEVKPFVSERLKCDPDRIQIADQFTVDARAEPFDIVHCSEVIEHVERPGDLLEKMRLACRDGGYLFIQTPLADGSENRLWDQTAHLCILSPGALRVMLVATGWAPVERLTHYWPGGQFYVARAGTGQAKPRPAFHGRDERAAGGALASTARGR